MHFVNFDDFDSFDEHKEIQTIKNNMSMYLVFRYFLVAIMNL